MSLIVAIEPAGHAGRGRRVLLADGCDRLTSASAVKELALQVGDDGSTIGSSLDAIEPRLARDRALALLGYRDRSSSELRSKLLDDGYPTALVAEIISTYERIELLDDCRYAASYSRTRASAGYGRSRVLRELRDKGVPAEIAQSAVDEVMPSEGEPQRAAASLRGRTARDRRERERLLRRLITRGFEFGAALQALDLSMADEPNPAELPDPELDA